MNHRHVSIIVLFSYLSFQFHFHHKIDILANVIFSYFFYLPQMHICNNEVIRANSPPRKEKNKFIVFLIYEIVSKTYSPSKLSKNLKH